MLVMECSALDEDFRGLPARRYTVVTVSRGGREVWRDYVAGVATACCGNARVAAVGAEDGSVYLYDRCLCDIFLCALVYIVCLYYCVCDCGVPCVRFCDTVLSVWACVITFVVCGSAVRR